MEYDYYTPIQMIMIIQFMATWIIKFKRNPYEKDGQTETKDLRMPIQIK